MVALAMFLATVATVMAPTPAYAAFTLPAGLNSKLAASRRYQAPPDGARTMATLVLLRDRAIKPVLAGVRARRHGPRPKTWSALDEGYELLRLDLHALFQDLGIAA